MSNENLTATLSNADIQRLGTGLERPESVHGPSSGTLAASHRGTLWVACIVGNRPWTVAPDGTRSLHLEDRDDNWVETVETAPAAGQMGRDIFYQTGESRLGNRAGTDFSAGGGTAYLGSLCGTSILSIPTPKGDAA